MSQYYIGAKQIFAYPQEKDGKAGYAVVYDYGTPREYTSWSPKEVFEKAYMPMGHSNDGSKITPEMVEAFVVYKKVHTEGKTTIVHARLANGFEIVESSSCVDPKNYSEELGAKICFERIKNQVWHLLGFVLQWARAGIG